MSTLPGRPNTELLVIDVQNGVVAGTPRRDEVIANINTLVERARAENVAPREQVIAHTNLYWTYQTAPGRTAGTAGTAEVSFR